MAEIPLRLLYVLLSETGKPVLPLMLGTFLAAVFCWRYSKPTSPVLVAGSEEVALTD